MPELPQSRLISAQVALALEEDLGCGDLTALLIDAGSVSRVEVICREQAVLCGCAWFDETFRQLNPAIEIEWLAADGERLQAGATVCRLQGDTRSLLSGERTALNYLQTLSGTATLARRYAEQVAGTGVRILDTRKTLPGLRLQQKYAVVCGGCSNHRIGLYDAILIKENHIRAAGSIEAALEAAVASVAEGIPIEIEVESLDELQQALAAGAARVLLDNFPLPQLREAVALSAGQVRLEASGGVTLETIRQIAETGVDDISVGGLTKDLVAVDLSMLFI
ncbi:carboxylating nicotinate-nucleotide diphosphorylase [Candidatus Endoriftia persephone]|jgi:nicotinate-nucleotide pyrophosphorylase (carboxylating)|uniref:Probable nicotinate-nucleotide pyrophosphorylase [carboxylating] n=3 Tax=Gammaproteobacteria TaxID=1236 RepID=G2FEK1_9GAMM|nr:carboxylating nicotinate-nucleotide diphosphorylase [Candidatus Endoriftia persephone]EGW54770.1 quinolinate phosphoribosyltransferase (decarboxylating) [endosymbiont of Tevnia jerichonana (vent Tica)]USF87289.1 carboxylating nicotinate-nucleotide diphosphorylase [Candidatus Endoriftia persephone]